MLHAAPDLTAPDVPDRTRERVLRELCECGFVDPDAEMSPMPGGRTNRVWQVATGRAFLVCKLYVPGRDSVLFPNDPLVECRTLSWLKGQQIAPTLIDCISADFGTLVLYEYVMPGSHALDPAACGRLLARMHATEPPGEMRAAPNGASAVASQTRRILAQLTPGTQKALGRLEPDVPQCDPVPALAFLHGDPVPANFVAAPNGHYLIDWQCPAIGDPCDDLAMFLSPAMQILYGEGPLDEPAKAAFLNAYGAPDLRRRLATLMPLFHWRMAAHCQWKLEQGEHDYEAGRDAELTALAAF